MKRIFFPQNLDAWMRRNDVTSKDLAEETNRHFGTINRYRAGTRCPSLDDLVMFKDMMGVTLDEMILEDDLFDEQNPP